LLRFGKPAKGGYDQGKNREHAGIAQRTHLIRGLRSSQLFKRDLKSSFVYPGLSLPLAFVLEQTMQTGEEPVKVSLRLAHVSTFD